MAYSTKKTPNKFSFSPPVQVFLFFLTVFIFVFLMVTRNTNLRLLPKASISDVALTFQTTAPGTTNQTIKVLLEAGPNTLGFARVKVTFDKTKINLTTAPTIHPQFQTIIPTTDITTANSQGSIEFVIGLSPTAKVPVPTGSIVLAELPYRSLITTANTSTVLSYETTDIQIVDLEPKNLNYTIQPFTLVLNPTASPTTGVTTPTMTTIITPTRTPTPVRTTTPTRTPTPVRTTTPTRTPTPGGPTPTPTIIPTDTPVPTPTSVIPNAPQWFFVLPSNLRGFLEQLYLTVFVFRRETNLKNLLDDIVPSN